MKLIEISEIRKFTSALFAGTAFDTFCVTEASFSTLFDIRIDGHINKEFLRSADGSSGDMETAPEAVSPEPEIITWGRIRPLCFDLIKGKRVPIRFKVVRMTPPDKVPGFITGHGLNYNAEDVNALFINIRFENGSISCTSAVSLKTFSMDKSLENAWDESVAKFLNPFV